jgi:flagellar protein FliO/FliZ
MLDAAATGRVVVFAARIAQGRSAANRPAFLQLIRITGPDRHGYSVRVSIGKPTISPFQRFPAAALLLAVSTRAGAQTATAATPEIGTSLIQVVLGLAVVVVLLLGSLHLLKRLQAPRGSAGGVLRTVTGIAVGPRERVVVLEVGETWLVVGVAPGRVNMLHSLPRQASASDSAPAKTGPQDFGKWLRQVMERRTDAR